MIKIKLLWLNFYEELVFVDLKKWHFWGMITSITIKAGIKGEVITSNYKKCKKKCLFYMLDCVDIYVSARFACVTFLPFPPY